MYIGLGSNLGDRRSQLDLALTRLRDIADVRRVSSYYRTEPVGHARQPDFYNAVAEIRWDGPAAKLLAALKRIERQLGRVARFVNGPREIDLDILDFGGVVRERPDPVLPHPRMADRRFVLAPLAEIAPGWRHPADGRTAQALLAAISGGPRVRRLPRERPAA
ncbi:MAG: 2-amino-4-hydroxy-6-hydroxymethyldihydropteridine diphosphokinase [Acidobacteriota bacterium]